MLVAAEVNARIIGGHRKRLSELADASDKAKAKVLAPLASAADADDHAGSAAKSLLQVAPSVAGSAHLTPRRRHHTPLAPHL